MLYYNYIYTEVLHLPTDCFMNIEHSATCESRTNMNYTIIYIYIIQIYAVITWGRVLNRELYTQKVQKLMHP